MMDATQAKAVYELVASGFAELGVSDPKCISRSILLKNLRYAGQTFRCDGWRAVWLLGSETIELQDSVGNPVRSASLNAEMTKKAA